jgi:TRAP-type mannitol/chloroaromatic compound transport system substrate-binding protein
MAINQYMLDEHAARNNAALKELVEVHGVQLRKLPNHVIVAPHRASDEALRDLVASDPMAQKVYDSFSRFYQGAGSYHHI